MKRIPIFLCIDVFVGIRVRSSQPTPLIIKMIRLRRYKTFLFCFAFLCAPYGWAAPSSKYWSIWDEQNPASKESINHQPWQMILDNYLVELPGTNLFRYQTVSADDRKKLQSYLKQLADTDPRRYSKPEQKAYWINFYNALTVNLILEKYPVKSITNIGWFNFGPWNRDITKVAGQNLSLNDIEHRILRPLWKDSRIHYAVNCASLGCPDLSPRAYTAANVEDQLDAQARRFIQQEKGVDWIDGRLVLSRIFEWYESDFGTRSRLIEHLTQYSTPATLRKLSRYNGVVEYQYDWNLNELK